MATKKTGKGGGGGTTKYPKGGEQAKRCQERRQESLEKEMKLCGTVSDLNNLPGWCLTKFCLA